MKFKNKNENEKGFSAVHRYISVVYTPNQRQMFWIHPGVSVTRF